MHWAAFPLLTIFLYLATVIVSYWLRDIDYIYGGKKLILMAVYLIMGSVTMIVSILALHSLGIMPSENSGPVTLIFGGAVFTSLLCIWVYFIDRYNPMTEQRKNI